MNKPTKILKPIAKSNLQRVRGGDDSPPPVRERQQLLATMVMMGM